jgi:hypothetical protein
MNDVTTLTSVRAIILNINSSTSGVIQFMMQNVLARGSQKTQ